MGAVGGLFEAVVGEGGVGEDGFLIARSVAICVHGEHASGAACAGDGGIDREGRGGGDCSGGEGAGINSGLSIDGGAYGEKGGNAIADGDFIGTGGIPIQGYRDGAIGDGAGDSAVEIGVGDDLDGD